MATSGAPGASGENSNTTLEHCFIYIVAYIGVDFKISLAIKAVKIIERLYFNYFNLQD